MGLAKFQDDTEAESQHRILPGLYDTARSSKDAWQMFDRVSAAETLVSGRDLLETVQISSPSSTSLPFSCGNMLV